MKNKSVTIEIVLLLSLLLLLSGCNNSAPDTRQQKGSNETHKATSMVDVIRLEGGDWGYPSPFAHYPRGPGGFKMALIFDSLLERDEKGLVPWLAEKYSIDSDGLTYHFTIRRGVHWQDGKPLTPADVVFSLDYANRHPTTWSYIFEAIDEVGKDQEGNILVRLKKPNAYMLDSIGRTRIIPKHIWEKVDNPKEFLAPEALVGSGPYRLTSYSKEHGTYRFESFDDFWGPKQRVKTIEFVPVSEPLLAYEKNELDLIKVTPDVLSRFKKDPTNKITQNPAFWGYRLLLNMSKEESLQSVQVRQSIAHAIDRQELVDKIARGAAVPGSLGILPPDHVMAIKNVRQYPFDLQQANLLLDQNGYDSKNNKGVRLSAEGHPFVLELLCSAQEVRMAELIRQHFREIGIELKIRSVDGKTRDLRVREKDYQLAIIGHGGWGGDPNYLVAHLIGDVFSQSMSPSESGHSGLDAPALIDLLQRQALEVDPDKRRQRIAEIQKMAAELVPEIPLFYTAGYSMYHPEKYDGWMYMYDHHNLSHGKLSYLKRKGPAAMRL